MKINIFPEFHLKEYDDDLKDEYLEFYKGNNKTSAFIINNSLYWLSAFISLGLLLILANYFKFAPFGDNSMFVMDGSFFNLPVLTDLIHSLQNGTFHYLTFNGSSGTEYLSTIAFYLSSPFTLFTLLFDQSTAVGLMTIFTIVRIAFSAPLMIYYLTHRENGRKGSKYDPSLLIFALGYSLSTYSLIQYNDFMYMDIFMLFPLFLLGIERIQKHGNWKLFYIIASVCLLSNFYLGITILLFGILLFFFQSNNNAYQTGKHFFTYLMACFFSLCTAAVTVIPGITGLRQRMTGNGIGTDFQLLIHPLTLFLQQLFFTDPSYYHTYISSCNIYIGLFALMLVFMHFLNTTKSIKRRITDFFFLLIIIAFLSISSLQFMGHLFYENETSFNNYCFVIFAVLMVWGFETFKDIRKIPVINVIISCILPILVTGLAMNLSPTKPNFQSVTYSIDLFILYTILIILYRLGSIKRESFYTIVIAVSVVELMANAFQSGCCILSEENKVNDVVISGESLDSESIFTDGRSEIYLGEDTSESLLLQLNSRNSNNSVISADENISDSPLDNSMANVNKLYVNEVQEENFKKIAQFKYSESKGNYKIFENNFKIPFSHLVYPELKKLTEPSDYVQRQNEIAEDLGATEQLYQHVNTTVSVDVPENVTFDQFNNNIFSFSVANNNENKAYYLITFHFVPEQSGDFYLNITSLKHFGMVEAGKSYKYEYYLLNQSDCAFNICFNGYLYSNTAQNQISEAADKNQCETRYTGSNKVQIKTEAKDKSTLLTSISFSKRFRVKVDGKTTRKTINYNGYLAVPIEKGTHTVTVSYMVWPCWVGLLVSLFSMSSILVFSNTKLRNKIKIKTRTRQIMSFLWNVYQKIYLVSKENYVYILAFVIPFIICTIGLVFAGCQPFGTMTVFVSDGQKLEIPTLLSSITHFKEHFPMGILKLCDTCFTFLFSLKFLYSFIPFRYLTTVLTFVTIAKISFSGVNMVFYLTHRLQGTAANKKDIKLLVAALCYSLSCYMILMICYWPWFNVFMLLPLIIYGMDSLIIHGKKRYYILFLSISVFLMYYVAMFICFYLVIRFFTYHFDNIKDFIKKGIRFALCSLSVLGLEYFIIISAFNAITGSTYGVEDSKAPSWFFFNGFDLLTNQLGFLKQSKAISWNEGNALLYMGMLSVFLLFVYIFAGNITWKEKLRQICPWVFLFVTMNTSVLNYIMNGFHYQHGVPNRFAFILVFISAVMSYDAMKCITKEKIRVIVSAYVSLVIIFSLAYWLGDIKTRSTLSYIATLTMLSIYLLVILFYRTPKFKEYSPVKCLILVFAIELVVNTCYQFYFNNESSYNLTYEKEGIEYIKENTDITQSMDRATVIAPICDSYNLVTPIKTMQLFSAGSITSYQINMARLCNYESYSNIIAQLTAPIELGNALMDNRYIILNQATETMSLGKLDSYEVKAKTENSIIMENKNVFPYGYYLPISFKNTYDKEMDFDQLYSKLFDEFTTNETAYIKKCPLFIDDYIDFESKLLVWRNKNTIGYQSIKNSLFTNPYITEDDLRNFGVNKVEALQTDKGKYNLDYSINIPEDGSLYISLTIPFYYGICQKGDSFKLYFGVDATNGLKESSISKFYIVNEEYINDLCKSVNQNALRIDSFTDKTLNGSITMPEDGIVCLSTPYKKEWHAYVDGVEVKTNAVADAFLSFEAPKGNHEIHLIDKSGNNASAVVITILSWILFAMSCYLTDKKHKKSKK